MPNKIIITSHSRFFSKFWQGLIIFGLLWLNIFQIATAQNQIFSDSDSSNSPINRPPEFSLNLSPPISYLSIHPGETKAFQLTLHNSGSRNLQVQLELAEFESDNLTGQPVIKPKSKFEYLKPKDKTWNWLQLNLVKSGETVKILLEIAVPSNAKTMEHHLTILAQAGATSAESASPDASEALGGSSSVFGLIGSNLILAIAKDSENLSQIILTDWEIPKFIDSLGGIDIHGLVKNTGSQSGPILGKANLIGPGGKLLKTWLIYPDMVLPNSSRAVRLIDTTQDPAADPESWLNQPNVQISSNIIYKPNWLFGNYTLKIQLFHQDYAEAQTSSEKIVQITALPYGILAIIIAIPICFGLFLKSKNIFGKYIASKTQN